VSGVTEHREVEYKYRVPAKLDVDVADLLKQCGASVRAEPQRSMSATYFDTANLTLLRWGITLRYRTGGGDDGWHLKIPNDDSVGSVVRDEIHVDASPGAVPIQLASIVAPLVRRQEILPLALVHTERTPFLV
jgi:inorganic triphosphatase YgiF